MAQDILTSSYPPLPRYSLLFFSVPLVVYFILLWARKDKLKKGLKPLPGPPRNIIGGNEGQFDTLSPFLTFEKWARQFGPIFQVKLGPQTIVSINDPRMAKELFEKRGSKYSGRLSPHVGYDLLSQGRRIIMTPNGPMHTAFRRQIHSILAISRTKENHKIQEMDSRQVLHDLLRFSSQISKGPPDYTEPTSILRRYTLSVMMTLSFGHRVSSLHDPIVKTVFNIMEDISRVAQPGQYLVDSFPILRKLPYLLRTWEHEMERKIKWQWAFLHDLLHRSETQMTQNIPNSGLIRKSARAAPRPERRGAKLQVPRRQEHRVPVHDADGSRVRHDGQYSGEFSAGHGPEPRGHASRPSERRRCRAGLSSANLRRSAAHALHQPDRQGSHALAARDNHGRAARQRRSRRARWLLHPAARRVVRQHVGDAARPVALRVA